MNKRKGIIKKEHIRYKTKEYIIVKAIIKKVYIQLDIKPKNI